MIESSILTLIVIIIFAAVIVFLGIVFIRRYNANPPAEANGSSAAMRLQAYERLILLTDRIALPNLISRLNLPGISAREMQHLLTQNIREEFNHNTTQQIYVTPEAWNAIRNLKDQNMLIINKLAGTLPES